MAQAVARLMAVLAGKIEPLGPEGLASAIRKHPLGGRTPLTRLGLVPDEQADQRHHGGEDKALHHYPSEHYAAWRTELPQRAARFDVGGFGENLSTTTLNESQVCIGDVFRVGSALLQVSQGRTPCRKLNLYFELPDMIDRVQANGRTGWYYRVLENGDIAAGDNLVLQERPCAEWTIARVQQVLSGQSLDKGGLAILSTLPQLAQGWREKAAMRLVMAT